MNTPVLMSDPSEAAPTSHVRLRANMCSVTVQVCCLEQCLADAQREKERSSQQAQELQARLSQLEVLQTLTSSHPAPIKSLSRHVRKGETSRMSSESPAVSDGAT